jgi:hypothetical protein
MTPMEQRLVDALRDMQKAVAILGNDERLPPEFKRSWREASREADIAIRLADKLHNERRLK